MKPHARNTIRRVAQDPLARPQQLIRALPVPGPGTIAVLGIDDFAFRKSHNYGSIVVDMQTHRPVDLLPDRLSDTFADWLRAHLGTTVICRDRAGGYAEGAQQGAPDAIQVADRFHLTDAVDKVVRAHRMCLRDQSEQDVVAQLAPPTGDPEGRRATLTCQRHAEVHALWDKGVGTTAISRALNLDHKSVLRYARAATAEELLTQMPHASQHTGRPHRLSCPALAGRLHQCRPARRGAARPPLSRGADRSLRRLLQTWRANAISPSATPVATLKPRQVTGWIIRPAAKRTEQDQADLARILARCPILRTVDQLVSDFAGMLPYRQGQHLDTWIANVPRQVLAQFSLVESCVC
jgi:hypothetical protein